MSNTSPATNYSSPRLPGGLVDRPNLLERLKRGAPLTIVRGPAGSGKTTLAAQWVHAQKLPRVTWVTLGTDETSRDQILRTIRNRLSQSVGAGTRGGAQEDRAEATLADIRELLEGGDVTKIVIDNYQSNDDSAFASDVAQILSSYSFLHLIVLTRVLSALESMQVAADVDVEIVAPHELLMSPGEGLRLASTVAECDVLPPLAPTSPVTPLVARLIGLATRRGLHLGLQEVGTSAIAEALLSKLLDEQQPDEYMEFLVRVSVAGDFDGELARALCDSSSIDEFIDRAEVQGIVLRDSRTGILSFAPFVSHGLLRILRSRWPNAEGDLRRIVTLWAVEEGRFVQALRNAIQIHDLYLASRVARNAWLTLGIDYAEQVIELVNKVERQTLGRHPILAMLLAAAYVERGLPGQAAPLYEMVSRTARGRTSDDDPVERFWMCALESAALRRLGRFHAANRAAIAALETLTSMAPELWRENQCSFPALVAECGLSMFASSKGEDPTEVFELGMTIAATCRRCWLTNASYLTGTAAATGMMRMARRTLLRAETLHSERTRIGREAEAVRLVGESLLSIEGGDFSHATTALDQADRLIQTERTFVLIARGSLHLFSNQPARASGVLKPALAHSELAHHRLYPVLRLLQFFSTMALGRRYECNAIIDSLPRNSSTHRVLRASFSFSGGELERAMGLLQSGETPEREPEMRTGALARLLCAAVANELGMRTTAERWVRLSFAQLDENQLRTPILLLTQTQFDGVMRYSHGDPYTASLRECYQSSGPIPMPSGRPFVDLSKRERLVLERLSQSSSIADVASELRVSPNTIKSQLRSAYRKLNVNSRSDAVSVANEMGLI